MHDGAAEVDPSLKQHWIFHPTHHDGAMVAEVGGRLKGSLGQGVDVVSGSHGACLVFDGSGIVAIEGGHDEERAHMPLGAMTARDELIEAVLNEGGFAHGFTYA